MGLHSVTECVHCLFCETVVTQMATHSTYYRKTPSPPSALAYRGLASMGQVRWPALCHKQALAGLTVDLTSCLSGQPILLCILLINSSSIMSFDISTHTLTSSFYRINTETLIYAEKGSTCRMHTACLGLASRLNKGSLWQVAGWPGSTLLSKTTPWVYTEERRAPHWHLLITVTN